MTRMLNGQSGGVERRAWWVTVAALVLLTGMHSVAVLNDFKIGILVTTVWASLTLLVVVVPRSQPLVARIALTYPFVWLSLLVSQFGLGVIW